MRPERSSATLGRTLRSILVAPQQGFGAAVSAAQRRARAGEALPEGLSPYVLALAGGASLMILWLKVGGLLGGREVDPSEFGGTELVFALVTGAVLALLGQGVWGVAAPAIARALKGSVSGRDARIVWGASAFPQVLTLLVLLPLDLLIVGPEVFATTRPGDSVATGWAAISVSLCALMAGWSLTLFVLGMRRVAKLELLRALGSMAAAAACLSLVIVAGSLILLSLWG
ncbi:MAG: hypothetical protein ACRDK3_10380 [Actinomycetota bacterium]